MTELRRFTALVNPIGGDHDAVEAWTPLALALDAAGAEVSTVLTRDAAHAAAEARRAAAAGDVVVAVGGDGLVRDLAGGVVAGGLDGTGDGGGALAVVPAGRGNDLAARLGIPRDPAGLTSMLLEGPVRPIDVLDADGVVVPGNVYVGVDSVATGVINRMRRVPSLLAYRLGGPIALLTWRTATFTLTTDDGTRAVRSHSVVAANTGAYGHGLTIVPSAEVDDGLIDLLVIEADVVSRLKIASYLAEARTGRHVERAGVTVTRTRSVRIAADRPVPLCADGDEIGSLPVTVTVRPGALRLVLPA